MRGDASMLKGRPGGERPRKKLSFREPEIMGFSRRPRLSSSTEDLELESQAMRIVRTVGQAFEVCHKLTAETPTPDDDAAAEPDAAGSERDSEPPSDKPRKDTLSEPLSLDNLTVDELGSLGEAPPPDPPPAGPGSHPPAARPLRLDILPPPPASASSRRSPLSGGETYSSPLSEPLRASGEGLPGAGTPLSAHHELQLLREQLEQQAQQTQAAVAQVHLLRDQLAAESAARLEAQARTHQLLVHNKELLDHIAALVAHLQEQERLQQRQPVPTQPHVPIVPQMPILCDPQTPTVAPVFLADFQDPAGLSYGFQEQQFQQQLLQRLQNLSAYRQYPPTLYPYQTPGYRVSQASSYSGSPVLPPRSQQMVHHSQELPDDQSQFIRPLSQVGTITTADGDGRVRVIVPIPSNEEVSNSREDSPSLRRQTSNQVHSVSSSPVTKRQQNQLASALNTLRVSDEDTGSRRNLSNGPPMITRSTSEKVPNRSELMSQVQRTAWARHTTK